jgi:hypothetical protein
MLKLQYLSLSDCNRITDAGLQHIAKLLELQHLDLSNCSRITDAGLVHVSQLHRLHHLDLGWNQKIHDHGLSYLSKLTKLQGLELHCCDELTNACISYISTLTSLRRLTLSFCEGISDVTVVHITEHLQQLIYLSLNGCTKITDASLRHLINLTQLQQIHLNCCPAITAVGRDYVDKLIVPKAKIDNCPNCFCDICTRV